MARISKMLKLITIKKIAHLSLFLIVIAGILICIFQLSSGLLPKLSGGQATPGKYLFGTLETANGSIFDTSGLSYADVAKKEHDAGIAVAQVTIAWKDYEIADGAFNENLMASMANEINIFLQAGQKVDVQLAIHYVPSWVMLIPDAYYINQYGVTAPQTDGNDDPNYVFNGTVRQKVQDFEKHALQQLNARVGLKHIWDFRVDGGNGGEAYYGPSDDGQGHTNSYWAYDSNAQGAGNALPPGVNKTPFPGWHPGETTYKGQSFTTSQVQQWYDWYFNSRMNYYNWQVALYRNAGFSHYLTFETPGFGTRPDEYTANIRDYLNGNGDPNGTMSRAAVWQNLYPALSDKTDIIAYVSSMADSSSRPPNDACQPGDANVAFNTWPGIDSWGAVRYVSYIANKYGFLKGGENPGYDAGGSDYGITMMNNAAREMATCGLIGMFWAHDDRLYTATNTPPANMVTLTDYSSVIHQYNFNAVRVRTAVAYTDSQGNPWSADRGFTTSNSVSSPAIIAGTSDPSLYHSYRYGRSFSYNFVLSNGIYNVTLKFAETHWAQPGKRIFSVAINGKIVLNNFDVLTQVSPHIALDKTFTITVINQNVEIDFNASVDSAMVSAIQIVPIDL
jgi:Malectin domain